MNRFIKTALLLPIITTASLSIANSNSGRWYQVEMIVLKNNATNANSTEQFDITVEPSAPKNVETLVESKEKEISFLDLDFQLLSQPDLDLQQLINDQEFTYEQVIRFFSSTHDVTTLLPKPYVLTQNEENTLHPYATKIKQSRNMVLIGHQTWRQPIWDKEVYSPVELNFGEQFGDQFEYSGWLHLTISRYIHVNPEMYINKFEPFTQEQKNALSFDTPNEYPLTGSKDKNPYSFDKDASYRMVSSIKINETQKTASKQVLYIDHPELAFLFYFTPVELVKE